MQSSKKKDPIFWIVLGKAKLRFELANPEDVTFIYSGKQKDTKDRSDEER